MNLLEAIRDTGLPIRFYQASSSESTARCVETPQSETTPFYPRSPYACAKVYSFWQTVNYREAYGMFACNGILFNHESPRRGETFVTRKITRAATRIKEGLQEKLLPGQSRRQARLGLRRRLRRGDVADAAGQDEPDDYVVATGETHSVAEFLDEVFGTARTGLEEIRRGRSRATSAPPKSICCWATASKARQDAGLEAEGSTFKALAKMMTEADWKLARRERLLADQDKVRPVVA